jgi:hypothetical protein
MLLALEDAMPEPLEARFERQVAEYLTGLFGDQASERRAAIRLAQVQVDRQRAEASSSSVGTLRAISIERQDSGHFAVNHGAVSIEASQPGPVDVPVSEGRSRRQLVAIGAVLSLSVLGLTLQLSHGSAPAASSAAASRGPPGTPLPTAPARLPVAPAVASAAPNSAPENKPAAEPADKRKTARASHAPSLPLKPQPSPPSTAAEPAPATAASSPSPPAPAVASSNAWNRGAFGGRH